MKKTILKVFEFLLSKEAKFVLKRYKPFIIGITGSVGKTTTKDITFHILKSKYNSSVHKSPKSYNGVLGLSLTYLKLDKFSLNSIFKILHIHDYPEIIVAEYGIDYIGDMDDQLKIRIPDIAIVTLIPDIPVHLLQMKTTQNVVNEKGKLIRALKEDSFAILNFDDKRVIEFAKNTKANVISFGKDPSYSIFASNIKEEGFKLSLDVTLNDLNLHKKKITFSIKDLNLPGEFNIYTLLPAIAASFLKGISIEQIQESLKDFMPPIGRLRILEGIKGVAIIDGSYNSSPVALKESLNLLGKIRDKKRIAVLGDMRELGDFEKEAHEKVREYVNGNCDQFISVGPLMKKYANPDISFDDSIQLGDYLLKNLQGNEVILFKGSRNTIFLERAIRKILKDPSKADELIVRNNFK